MSGDGFVFPKLYTEFAKYYDRLERQYRDYPKEAEWLQEIFRKFESKSILDVSCGTGSHIANLLKDDSSQRNFVGIDASKEMVGLCRQKLSNNQVSLARADFLHPPFRENSFDSAICLYWSIAGLNEDLVRKLFSEVHSILKKNGVFVLDTENALGIKENLINSPFIDAFFPIANTSGTEDSMLIRANFSTKVAPDVVDWHAYYLFERRGVSELQNDRMMLRFYSKPQLEAILSETGFTTIDVLSGPFQKYSEGSPSLYFIAKRG